MVFLDLTGMYSQPLFDYLSSMEITVCVESALPIKLSQDVKRAISDRSRCSTDRSYAYINYRELSF